MSIQSRRLQCIQTQTGQLLFDGRFVTPGTYTAPSTGSGTPPSPWASAEYVGVPNSAITVYDPAAKPISWWPGADPLWGGYPAAFTAYADGAQSTARAQAHSGPLLGNGDEVYFAWKLYVPSAQGDHWPVVGADGDWNIVCQLHSPPYSSSPGMAVSVKHYNGQLCLYGENGSGYPTWYAPITFDRWITVTQHLVVHTIGGQGLLEVWVDGVKQQQNLPVSWWNYDTTGQWISTDGTTAHIATEVKDTSGPGDLYLNMYRKGAGSNWGLGSVSVFHMGMKIGTSYNVVQ